MHVTEVRVACVLRQAKIIKDSATGLKDLRYSSVLNGDGEMKTHDMDNKN